MRPLEGWTGRLSAAAGLAVLLAGCGGGEGGGGRVEFLSLGTAGTGGIYYPLGGALASHLSLKDSLRQYTAEVTGGSVENINRIVNGEMDLAFALPVTMWDAYHGGEAYPEPVTDLRIVGPLYPNLSQVMVAANNDAMSIADLRGQRIAVGPPGSGTEQVARQILGAYGITYEDIDERFLSFAEAALALKDRAIDGAIISVGYPAASVLDATTTGDARLLAIEPEIVEAVVAEYPYYAPGVLPADAYPGVDAPLTTLAQINWVIARESLSGEIVRLVLDILAEERALLEAVHPQAAQIDIGFMDTPPIPLHPAAEAWLTARR